MCARIIAASALLVVQRRGCSVFRRFQSSLSPMSESRKRGDFPMGFRTYPQRIGIDQFLANVGAALQAAVNRLDGCTLRICRLDSPCISAEFKFCEFAEPIA